MGAQEVHFPALLPREPYEATGRWTEYGDNLFRLQDRKGADYLLGPTHEEMFTLLVKDLFSSYKDLPLSLYQIQTKYRDEARPRAGLLRGREFRMKDSYSFDIDDAGLQASYDAHRAAYIRIFDRLGLSYVVVKAMSGAMGGSASEEFLANAEVGEDTYVRCPSCGYAANVEAVRVPAPDPLDALRRARCACRGDSRHAHDRDLGRSAQRQAPARRPALERGRHPQERPRHARAPRRHRGAAGDRRPRRPGDRREAARRAGRARGARGVRRSSLRPLPRAGPRLHRPRRAGGGERLRRPLPARPPRGRRHPLGHRGERGRAARRRPGQGPRLRRRRDDRGGRGACGRRLPGVRRHARGRTRHRDRPHLPARPQVRRGAGPQGAGRERQAGHRDHGLLRDRSVAGCRRHRREHLRRARAGVAARGLARRRPPGGHRQGPGGLRHRGTGSPRSSQPPASRSSTTTARRCRPG